MLAMSFYVGDFVDKSPFLFQCSKVTSVFFGCIPLTWDWSSKEMFLRYFTFASIHKSNWTVRQFTRWIASFGCKNQLNRTKFHALESHMRLLKGVEANTTTSYHSTIHPPNALSMEWKENPRYSIFPQILRRICDESSLQNHKGSFQSRPESSELQVWQCIKMGATLMLRILPVYSNCCQLFCCCFHSYPVNPF